MNWVMCYAYYFGEGVERDEKKANRYHDLAAISGDVAARHNLGYAEFHAGNWERAIKHFMISVGGGENDSSSPYNSFTEMDMPQKRTIQKL